MSTHDVIVLGLGAMGSAAAWRLAARGMRVLGLEQFGPAHNRGSSHGRTRICRKAYFEHPDYVPLLARTYELWEQLERECAASLFERCGLLLIGDETGPVISGVRRAAREHALDIESVDAIETRRRFPAFQVSDSQTALFERDAGYLRVEQCVQAMQRRAGAHGAELRFDEAAQSWSADGRTARVTTANETHEAGALVICGGAWSGALLRELNLPLQVLRTVQLWFAIDDPVAARPPQFPVFGWQTDDGFFYGFPTLDGRTAKAAEHGGEPAPLGPDGLDRDVRPRDVERVWRFLEQHVRGYVRRVVESSVCMYTMTPDEHFIIDRDPRNENVAVAVGFSGHGFKFAPIIGEVLADFAARGRTTLPVEFLGLRRVAAAR